MTLPPEAPGPDPLLDEAIAWIVHLKTGEPTRDDVEALERWRGQSAAHEAAFKRAARIQRDAGIVAGRLTTPATAPRIAQAAAGRRRISRRFVLGGGLAAAAAAGYAVIQPPLGLWPSLQELSADYRTAKGEQRKVQVTPEVSLDLNTQTSIALRSQQGQPTIELISGEVLVDARHPASGPLVMLAAGGQIGASEAQFNAQCFDAAVSVTCLNGTVDVQHSGQSVRIGKGQQLSYTRAGIGPSMNVDPAQVTAWQSGLLIFRDRPLAAVVEEVNRYRPGKIVIVSAELRQRAVNGDFEIKKLDSFVTQVEQLFGAHATSLPGGLVLLS
ncbi:FecR domain-containing protein [Bradyrhizobium sp. dw_411]|uniref:FecR family protein n=1 Tax=Bradyrhizobium sp. dw_411 TaxID=2720082 RepID=UPI001BCA9A46